MCNTSRDLIRYFSTVAGEDSVYVPEDSIVYYIFERMRCINIDLGYCRINILCEELYTNYFPYYAVNWYKLVLRFACKKKRK